MQKRWNFKRCRFTLAVLAGALCLAPPVHKLAEYPSDIHVQLGERTVLPIGLPVHTKVTSSDATIVQAASRAAASHASGQITLDSREIGDATVSTKLFGVVPWKAVRVHVVPQELVYVGGQSIGVRLKSKGVIVVGYQNASDGQKSPAAQAHIQVGDVIEKVGTHAIESADDVHKWIRNSTEPVTLTIRRGQTRKVVQIRPVKSLDGNLRLGMYVRDKTAGIGTLTFYDPEHHCFGALGHVITDADTGQSIVGTGTLYEAQVTGIVKGLPGRPGEKKGHFLPGQTQIGHIDENTDYGVFGSMPGMPGHAYMQLELPVALPEQVHDGPAKMLTVINGQQVEAFDVEIDNLVRQENPSTKSMIVHVTDPRLLREAGGIVQGMSGSPLIQDGRLVGAVTHVFLSDVTRGYGVYAAWMMHEAVDDDSPAEAHQTEPARRALMKHLYRS